MPAPGKADERVVLSWPEHHVVELEEPSAIPAEL